MYEKNNKRIAINTILLYVRMILTILVSLYVIRIVLDVLGVEDYGLYSVVGGVVALLSFLPVSMASSTQRFFSHALGENNNENLKKIFGVNILLYLSVSLIALVLLNTVGLWYIENKLILPNERMDSLRILFFLSNFTFFFKIIKSPFMAIIIAHENMKTYAYLAIFESLFKLLGVLFLTTINGDKLVLYGLILLIISILESSIYILITFKKYDECSVLAIKWDKKIAGEIINFTSWTLFGQLTTVFRGSAITLLINQYFNPLIVAARTLAVNISIQSTFLAQQFNTSLYPPIIKSYSSKNLNYMFDLIFFGSKISFFLMWIIALPVIIEIENILNLWLTNIPEYTDEFAVLTIIESLIFAVSLPLTTAARAPGKMKLYETVLGIQQVSIFFIAWVLFDLNFNVHYVFYICIVMNIVMFFSRLFIVNKLINIGIKSYIKIVLPPIFKVTLVSYLITYLINNFILNDEVYLVISLLIYAVTILISIYFFGLNKSQKKEILKYLIQKLNI